MLVAFGFVFVTNLLLDYILQAKLIGGLLLLYLAYKEFRSEISVKEIRVKGQNFCKLVIEIFFPTLSNPMTIMTLVAIFAGVADSLFDKTQGLVVVLGVFL